LQRSGPPGPTLRPGIMTGGQLEMRHAVD
jgi:hypothetical protein